MPTVHIVIARLIPTSRHGGTLVYYTACGRPLTQQQSTNRPADVTCTSCNRTAYAAFWRQEQSGSPSCR